MLAHLQFLLVNREVAGLDVEHAIAGEAQHVFVAGVPCNTVGIRLLHIKCILRRMFLILFSNTRKATNT